MAATVNVNSRTVVHAESEGLSLAFPDICLTPPVPTPIPYPNIAESKDTADGSATVQMDGCPIMLKSSKFAASTGDEGGVLGGLLSGVIKGTASFVSYSFDVKVEGQPVPRQNDYMLQNASATGPNTPPGALMQPGIKGETEDVTSSDNKLIRVELV